MLKVILCSILLWSSISTGEQTKRYISPKCDHMGVTTLMCMGLEPQFEEKEECPTSWKWPQEKKGACYYMGKYHNHGEDFIRNDENMDTTCNCNVRKGNRRIVCDAANWNPGREASDMNYTCELGNSKYNGNEIFWPQNTCLTCICKPGFKGEYLPPFCKHNSSDINFYYQKEISQKCTPSYDVYSNYENPALCFPSGFICNDDLYEISPINVVKDSKDSNMCTIDNEFYPKRTVLNVTYISYNRKNNVNCTCLTPPFFTCVNKYHNDWIDIMPIEEVLDEVKTMPEENVVPVLKIA